MLLCCSRVVVDSVALGGAVCGCVGFIVAFRVLCGLAVLVFIIVWVSLIVLGVIN